MFSALRAAVCFAWTAPAGNRLRPWRSEYLRWRLETYSGQPAKSIRPRDFLHLAIAERRQVGRFVRWMGEMRDLAGPGDA